MSNFLKHVPPVVLSIFRGFTGTNPAFSTVEPWWEPWLRSPSGVGRLWWGSSWNAGVLESCFGSSKSSFKAAPSSGPIGHVSMLSMPQVRMSHGMHISSWKQMSRHFTTHVLPFFETSYNPASFSKGSATSRVLLEASVWAWFFPCALPLPGFLSRFFPLQPFFASHTLHCKGIAWKLKYHCSSKGNWHTTNHTLPYHAHTAHEYMVVQSVSLGNASPFCEHDKSSHIS